MLVLSILTTAGLSVVYFSPRKSCNLTLKITKKNDDTLEYNSSVFFHLFHNFESLIKSFFSALHQYRQWSCALIVISVYGLNSTTDQPRVSLFGEGWSVALFRLYTADTTTDQLNYSVENINHQWMYMYLYVYIYMYVNLYFEIYIEALPSAV
jgi:hypothetical protein